MRLDKCSNCTPLRPAFSTLLWLPTCSLSEPEKWGMVSPEGLRELGFRSVITSLSVGGGQITGSQGEGDAPPGQAGGCGGMVLQTLRTPNACFRSVLLSSFCPVSGGGVLGYRQPQRHTDFCGRCGGIQAWKPSSRAALLCGLSTAYSLTSGFPSGKV